MTITWKSVYSTTATDIGYDDETEELLVRWQNGKVSAYAGVDAKRADEISRAPSVGSALMEIKASFPHRYRSDLR